MHTFSRVSAFCLHQAVVLQVVSGKSLAQNFSRRLTFSVCTTFWCHKWCRKLGGVTSCGVTSGVRQKFGAKLFSPFSILGLHHVLVSQVVSQVGWCHKLGGVTSWCHKLPLNKSAVQSPKLVTPLVTPQLVTPPNLRHHL